MPQSVQNHTGQHSSRPGAVSSRPGLCGVFKTLADQHRQLMDMLQRVKLSRLPSERQGLWSEIRHELLSHERGEVLEVYAELEGYDAARHMCEQHNREADELEATVNELDELDYSSEDWHAKLLDVLALFEDHVNDEESDFFPRAQQLLGEQVSEELEERFVSAQREIANKLP